MGQLYGEIGTEARAEFWGNVAVGSSTMNDPADAIGVVVKRYNRLWMELLHAKVKEAYHQGVLDGAAQASGETPYYDE